MACHFCDNAVRGQYPDLSPATFRKIVDQLNAGTHLALHGLGEPTLHPLLKEFVSYAKSRELYVYFNTNLVSISEVLLKSLIDSGLDELRISLSAGNSKSFLNYAKRDSFNKVLENTRLLLSIRGLRKKPLVRFVFVLTANNGSELSECARVAEELGVDQLQVQTELNWGLSSAHSLPSLPKDLEDKTRKCEILLPDFMSPSEPGQCEWPFKALWLTAEGTATPCCNLHRREHSLGDATAQPLSTLWKSEPYLRFRKDYDLSRIAQCQSCPIHFGKFKSYSYAPQH